MVVGVLVELANKNVDRVFDYLVPFSMQEKVKVGLRVCVPFAKRTLEGFILEVGKPSKEDVEYKEVIEILDKEVILNDELLELGKYIQKTTLSTLIKAYQVMLPKALKAHHGNKIPIKKEKYLIKNQSIIVLPKLTDKQEIIMSLFDHQDKVRKKEAQEISIGATETLLKKQILQELEEEVYRLQKNNIEVQKKKELTMDQARIVKEVLENRVQNQVYLLHGVTGSGKTEVYMELIEEKLKQGKTAIVLVPEISLTPQIIERFQKRFEENIAILHSRLSDGEKYDEWRKIAREEVKIVIGARSAIFAPLKNIGIIIIDEEHTSSYKQENNPKYSAIDIAIKRGDNHKCPVILGSATPSLESYARAQKKVYHLLNLPNRVNGKPLPQMIVIDMEEEIKKGNHLFSKLLQEKIQDRLEKKEQILLLLNRRGYSSYITCSSCGYTEKCPNCDITLTYHKTSNTLRCHYCGYGTKKQETCPLCKEKALKAYGSGTERIEEEIKKRFPSSKIVRMDVDTTNRKGAHEKIIKDFQNEKYNILLGTQMIAKGLDFPKVTLVGIINADTSLNIPDFRSSEVTFQLLDQVGGRSGRGDLEGEVIIQTFNPDHYAIVNAENHDYRNFYQEEMKIRRELKYPPYFYITYVKILSNDYEKAKEASNQIGVYLKKELKNSIVLGPSVCNVFKVNNIFRFGIMIKYKKEEQLYPTLIKLQEHYKTNTKITLDIEFNPNRLS